MSLKLIKNPKKDKNKTKKFKQIISEINKKEMDVICTEKIPFQPFINKLVKKINDDKSTPDYNNIQKLIIKNLKTAINPSGIKAYNDYYSYINERWLMKDQLTKDQEYIVQVDDFRLVQDKVYYQLLDIVKEYIKKNHNPLAKCMKKFYNSMTRLNNEDESKKYCISVDM